MYTQVALQGVVSDALGATALTVTQADISVGAARVTTSHHARTLTDRVLLARYHARHGDASAGKGCYRCWRQISPHML